MRGAEVLSVLQGDPGRRPAPDGALIAAARAHLEAAAAGVEAAPEGVVVRVTKEAVAGVRRCELRHLDGLGRRLAAVGQAPVPAVVRGRLVDAIFRQVATTGRVGTDPVADAVTACAAESEPVEADLEALSDAERAQVRAEVEAATATLVAGWPALPPGAGVRTQERVLVELAGGRVVLSGRPDLAVGRPTRRRAGVLVCEAKSGSFRPAHLEDIRFYALLEALRWGVAPFRGVVWSLGDGRLEVLDIDADLLWSETLRVADAVARLTRLAAGQEPRASANPLCPSCPLVDGCPDGRRQVALAEGGLPARGAADDEDTDEHGHGHDGAGAELVR